MNQPAPTLHPPVASDDCPVLANVLSDLRQAADDGRSGALALLKRLDADASARSLLEGIFSGSPFLSGLILRDPGFAVSCLERSPDEAFGDVMNELEPDDLSVLAQFDLSRHLRQRRARAALLIALADLSGRWPVADVTRALTAFADGAIQVALKWLLLDAARRGQFELADDSDPAADCGYVVLAMGKQGAGELNYSSDIDLIILYDPDQAPLAEGTEPSRFFVRLTRQLVALLQEYTSDGYVFRVDLRLRPDPRATQVAIAIEAAAVYYESMGQNWERAAMIKARAAAGDIALGEEFLDRLKPYVWRKYLDFAAIADVQSMKRQIHAAKGHDQVAVAGHNIKLGRGGIREIEFFVQTQQLIAGGRNPQLRGRRTLDMLDALAEADWVTRQAAAALNDAYRFLRAVEHRVQMVNDEQTQVLPSEPARLADFARFCGYRDPDEFTRTVMAVLETVEGHYAELFEEAGELTDEDGNLVFTGADDDPGTLATLERLGYRQAPEVAAVIRGWHFGRYPATRAAKAREVLTELMPVLLKSLAETGDADAALYSFDRFLAGLPAGLQLFSMLRANPQLLDLIASILGTAPRLARELSRRPRVLDAVLDPGFFDTVPGRTDVDELIATALPSGISLDEALDPSRTIGNELSFRIGVRVLSGTLDARTAAEAYSTMADALIGRLLEIACDDLVARHGRVAGGEAAIVAMGKLGSREMTAGSDLDLILVYDHADDASFSDGAKALSVSQYYARVTQRLIAALSSPTGEGVLYEVDMRLRPSGNKGPVASHIDAFVDYHTNSAWTWERMALTRARVIAGSTGLAGKLSTAITGRLTAPADVEQVCADVVDMRRRILEEHGKGGVWNIKATRGGLVDVEFIAQAMQLWHGHSHPDVLARSTRDALSNLAAAGLLPQADHSVLIAANDLYHQLTQILRICVNDGSDPAEAPAGLQRLIADAAGQPDIATTAAMLDETQQSVTACFERLIAPLRHVEH